MSIWFALAVPVVTAAILLLLYHHKTRWWEFLIPFCVSACLIGIFKLCATTIQTQDVEYWGGWITHAEHFEAWDKKVSCRHKQYISVPDGDGGWRRQFVGYQHKFDVKEHEAYSQVHDSNGQATQVDQATFEGLCDKFGERKEIDLNREFHSIDGDKHVTVWPDTDETLMPVTTVHEYKNRVQASRDVVRFKSVDPKEFGLFDYPEVTGYYRCPSVLGDGGSTQLEAEKLISYANARLGKDKEVRMWVLIFKGQPPEAGEAQYHYWKGGNKNEFTLCIGVDSDYMVQWCRVISWTDVKALKDDAYDYVVKGETHKLDLAATANWLTSNIEDRFVRKEFADFSRVKVNPPLWAIIVTFVLTAIVNVALSAWIVRNEYQAKKKLFE